MTFFLVNTAFIQPEQEIQSKTQSTIEEENKQMQFIELLSYFENKMLPLEILPQSMEEYGSSKTKTSAVLSSAQLAKVDTREFRTITQKFIPGLMALKFSRMGPPLIVPVARYYPSEETVAIIYELRHRYSSPNNRSFYLSYYDLKGNLLNQHEVKNNKRKVKKLETDFLVASISYLETRNLKIDKWGTIQIDLFENNWEQDPKKVSMEDNQFLALTKVKQERYELHPQRGIIDKVETIRCGVRP